MSTFNGQVIEFPDIRVDFFRHAEGARPPLACFLSHVHSDHLAGLESLKAPFVYCSAATREILLRLERFPHRVNFQLGILQARVQHYRHLKNLLKPLPLETPTRIELAPGKEIQVTLFDANHCTGSVMFLIEGDGKAILYTGDIRSEPWHVNALRRNPILMEYTSGLKKLDCVYLDTTFTDDIHFPTKAEGLSELLTKIRKYPADTTFHFTAWTFGYEEVWVALSKALKSPIHVDQYKLSLYESLCPGSSISGAPKNPVYLAAEAPALIGHHYGNNYQKGCLTLDPTVRIHSCDKGMRCPALGRNTVYIQPILARGTNGVEMLELGAGGGQGDLTHKVELEIDGDAFVQRISSFFKNASQDVIDDMKSELTRRLHSGRNTVSLEDMGLEKNSEEMSVEDLVQAALSAVPRLSSQNSQVEAIPVADEDLPRTITFPYSRHASYEELCDLVAAFQPADVYPCTVDERKWFSGITMKSLFGRYCDTAVSFRHDMEMQTRYGKPATGATQTQHPSQVTPASDELVAIDLDIPGSATDSVNQKRKAEDSPGGDSKRARELSILSDHSIDWTSSYMSADTSDDEDVWQMKDPDSHDMAFWMFDNDEDANNIWDPTDEVWRCNQCGWEKWYRYRPCECGRDAGVELTAEWEMSRAGFQFMHMLDNSDMHADIDLMNSPSDYDSVSDAEKDEYHLEDSFIDGAPTIEEQSSDRDSDYEVDDKARYLEALAKRNLHNKMFIDVHGFFREQRMEVLGSEYESDKENVVFNDEDSDLEAGAEDPDFRYLWERMTAKADEAVVREAELDAKWELFRRAEPGYISEEDPYGSAWDSEFDPEFDIPRSIAKKSDAENEVLKKKWAKECEKFLRLYKELLNTRKSFMELRKAVLGKNNDKYKDVAGDRLSDLMSNINMEPKPYGTHYASWMFTDENDEVQWEWLSRRAHIRVQQVKDLLRSERKTFKEWRRSHKEDYVSYEDPYDSEYPTTIGDDDAEAQFLDQEIRMPINRDVYEASLQNPPEVPSLAGDGVYRTYWAQSCRIFSHLVMQLNMRKNNFKKYREMAMGAVDIDTRIELGAEGYADKLFSLDEEPRPHGKGKLGRYGNDERGWDWKGLAEKSRVRILQMQRLLQQEVDAHDSWRESHAAEYDSDCTSVLPEPGEDLWGGSEVDSGCSNEDCSACASMAGRWRAQEAAPPRTLKGAVWKPKIYKQSRVTDYFAENDHLHWYLFAREKASAQKRPKPKEKRQTRLTNFMSKIERARTWADHLHRALGNPPGPSLSNDDWVKEGDDPAWTLTPSRRSRLDDQLDREDNVDTSPVSNIAAAEPRQQESAGSQTEAEADRVLREIQNGGWHQTGLLSVDNNHTKEETEL